VRGNPAGHPRLRDWGCHLNHEMEAAIDGVYTAEVTSGNALIPA
jgi:hypothetical protein